MTDSGMVDLTGVPRLLSHFRASGCKGAVVAGTNGEGPSLSAVEKRDLLRVAASVFPDFPIVVGIATPSLQEAIWLANQSAKAGAVAGLAMAPGYFRDAGEEGITNWFERLFDSVDLPMLVYNFPQRTGFVHSAANMARLAQHEKMVGLKDSSGEAQNIEGFAKAVPTKAKFVGNETLLLNALAAGWTGTISGASNSIPGWLAALVRDWEAGDQESAEAKFELIKPAIEALRMRPQPAANKAILRSLRIIDDPSVRLPLSNLAPGELQPLQTELQQFLT